VTVVRGFAIILGSGVIFAIGGAGIGYSIGHFMPSFYRGIFANGESLKFFPELVGLGLGFTQGITSGLAVGSVVVMAVALSEWRRPAKDRIDLN